MRAFPVRTCPDTTDGLALRVRRRCNSERGDAEPILGRGLWNKRKHLDELLEHGRHLYGIFQLENQLPVQHGCASTGLERYSVQG